MAIRARFTTVITPSHGQVRAEELAAEGRPAPGMPPAALGFVWEAVDVTRGRVAASGHEATPEEAEAAAARRIEALLDADTARVYMEETRHQRAGRVSMEELAGGDC